MGISSQGETVEPNCILQKKSPNERKVILNSMTEI